MSKKKNKSTTSLSASEVVEFLLKVVTSAYVIVFMIAMPLLYHDNYYDIGDYKYKIFLYTSRALLAAGIPLMLVYFFVVLSKTKDLKGMVKNAYSNLNIVDKFVLLFLLSCTLTFLFSPYRTMKFMGAASENPAWFGYDGWFMGFRSQLIFICIYFMVSHFLFKNVWKDILTCTLVVSFIIYSLALLQRFGIDPLKLHEDLNEYYRLMFMSTLGQATWYSSYLCIVLPIGLVLFWNSENKRNRILFGIYTFVGFASLVTQNSDSAYLAFIAMMCVLFFASFDTNQAFLRFWECTILILASFITMGLLYKIFAERATKIEGISVFMMQSPVMYVLLLLVIAIYLVIRKRNQDAKFEVEKIKLLKNLVMVLIPVGIVGVVALIIITTLQVNQGIPAKLGSSNYFVFDNGWGNWRGFAWKLSMQMIASYNPLQLIFGVGSDCFASYGIDHFREAIAAVWGDAMLTCSHNEWLNMFVTNGLMGFVTYTGIFVSVVRYYYVKRTESVAYVVGACCAAAYIAHNLTCYQQICCTPIIFIIIAAVSHYVRYHNNKG